MKIVHINSTCGTGSNGRIALELALCASKQGHTPWIFSVTGMSNWENTYCIASLSEQRLHAVLSRITGLQGYFSFSSTKRMIAKLEEIKPDIVHLHNMHSNYLNLPALFEYFSKHDVAVILTLHDCWMFTGKCTYPILTDCNNWEKECGYCPQLHIDKVNPTLFFDRTKKCFNDKKKWFAAVPRMAVVGVSDWVTNEAKRSILGIKSPTRIYNWIDRSVFYPRNANKLSGELHLENKRIVLMVSSSICENKGYGVLIELSKRLNDEYRLVVIGKNKDNLEIPLNVLHISHTDNTEELANFYSLADVCVNTTRCETFGMVTAEAMSCGTPVVVYNNTASPEIVNERCGIVAENGDIEGVVKAVEEICNKGKEHYESSCVEYVSSNFDKVINTNKYMELYGSLVSKKKKRPKISIITVSYNSVAHIEETIKSIVNQDYDNKEYIIIDGGSKDGTLDIINKYRDKIDYFVSEPDKGISDAFNKGIKVATGDIIGIVNSDDFMMPNVLSRVADEYVEGVDVYRGYGVIWDEKSNSKRELHPNERFGIPPFGAKICHECSFISRKRYNLLDGYRVDYKYMMDLELFIRMYKDKTLRSRFIDICVITFRTGGASSSSAFKIEEERKRLVHENGGGKLITLLYINYHRIKYICKVTLMLLMLVAHWLKGLGKKVYMAFVRFFSFFTKDIISSFLLFLFLTLSIMHISMIKPSSEVISTIIAVVASIIGIAFPIVIGTVSDKLVAYNSKIIANSFKNESCYILMLILIPFLAVLLVVYMLFNIPCEYKSYIEGMMICGSIFSLFVFYRYIKRAIDYSVNTDEVVFQICKRRIEKVTYNRNTFEKYLGELDLCSCVIQKKIKSGNPNNLREISELMKNVIKGMFSELKFDYANEGSSLRKVSIKYYSIIYNSWHNSYSLYPDEANMLLGDYEEVVKYAVNDRKSFEALNPFFYLYQRIANEISEEHSRKIPYIQYSPWGWYFNIVFDEDFYMGFLGRANMYLFTIMKNAIDNGGSNVFESFISRCVDGMLYIPDFYYPDSSDEGTCKLLSKIRTYINFAYTLDSFDEVNELIKEMDTEKIDRGLVRQLVIKQYKYNNLQLLVAIIASYCYFKNHTNYVNYILFYNQPHNSATCFVNHDIVPDNLMTIILWHLLGSKLLFNYNILWSDHNEAKTWFNKGISIMACRISEKGKDLNTVHYDEIIMKLNKQQCEALEISIEELKKEVVAIANLKDFDLKDTLRDITKNDLEAIKGTIAERKERVIVTQETDVEKEKKFKENIVNMVRNNLNWGKVFSDCYYNGNAINEQILSNFEQTIEKSFLAKNDEGIYIGTEQAFASRIIDQIDWNVEIKLRAISKMHNRYEHIRKENFKHKILELTDKEVVVFVNYFVIYDFLLNDKGFQWKNAGHVIGITKNGTTILSLVDNYIKKPRLFILDKTEWSPFDLDIPCENIVITDLNKDDNMRNKILASRVGNELENQDKEREEIQLKKSVNIKISGSCMYKHTQQPNVAYIDNLQ